MSVSEQRNFFRARGRVGLRVQQLSAERWDAEERNIRSDWSEPKELPESELTAWLERLEQKLDLLLDRLDIPNPARALRTESQDVVISGGGLSFESEHCFAEGAGLLVELDVGKKCAWIRCLGSVVRCEVFDEGLGFKVVVRFDVIREVDRDRIIEFALETERRCIQERVESA